MVPQANMQSLRATIRSTQQWLTIETTVAGKRPANADQHAWGIQLTTRLPRDVRQRRNSRGYADRGGLHGHRLSVCDVTGRVVLTKR